MIKCIVCLRSTENLKMTPFNDKYLSFFNLLTSLQIQLCDVTRQHLCEYCIEMLNLFVEFRNKCILANSVLQRNNALEENIKKEEERSIIINNIKIETEVNQKLFSDDSSLQDFMDIDDQFVSEHNESDMKSEYFKAHKKKQKINNLARDFFCGLCPKTFYDRNSMSDHLDSHRIKNDACLLCTDRFTDWQQLISHRLKHVPWKDKTCHICFKRFQSSPYLEHHYKNVHSVDEKSLLWCLQCNKSYNTPKQLQKHIWGCHSNKKFICDYCSREFTSKQQIKIHIVVHMEYKPFVCDLCGFSCKLLGNLKSHKLRKHTPKRVYCKNCNRVFGNQLIRDNHKCLQKLSVCSTCGKIFVGIKQLKRHMASHDPVGKYRCERCPAAYKTRDALSAHRDRHDGVRSKHCEYCPKKFYTSSVLIKHRRTHTGIKPYVCRICQKAFTGNNNLKVHMRVHGEYLITKKVQNDIENANSEIIVCNI